MDARTSSCGSATESHPRAPKADRERRHRRPNRRLGCVAVVRDGATSRHGAQRSMRRNSQVVGLRSGRSSRRRRGLGERANEYLAGYSFPPAWWAPRPAVAPKYQLVPCLAVAFVTCFRKRARGFQSAGPLVTTSSLANYSCLIPGAAIRRRHQTARSLYPHFSVHHWRSSIAIENPMPAPLVSGPPHSGLIIPYPTAS